MGGNPGCVAPFCGCRGPLRVARWPRDASPPPIRPPLARAYRRGRDQRRFRCAGDRRRADLPAVLRHRLSAFADQLMGALGRVSPRGVRHAAAPSARVNSALLFTPLDRRPLPGSAVDAPGRARRPPRRPADGAPPPRSAGPLAPRAPRPAGRTTSTAQTYRRMSLEPKVAEALASAWRARAALRLSPAPLRRASSRPVSACAYSAPGGSRSR